MSEAPITNQADDVILSTNEVSLGYISAFLTNAKHKIAH
jgi:hypothetical protein